MLFQKKWKVKPYDKIKVIKGEHKGITGEVFKVTKYNGETMVMVETNNNREMIKCSINQVKKILLKKGGYFNRLR